MMIAFGIPGLPEVFVMLCVSVFAVLPFWMICSKAGFPGWYSLVLLIPGLNLLFPFFLAFADWPSLRQISGDRDRILS